MVEAWQLLKGAEPSRKVNSTVSGPSIGHLFSIPNSYTISCKKILLLVLSHILVLVVENWECENWVR